MKRTFTLSALLLSLILVSCDMRDIDPSDRTSLILYTTKHRSFEVADYSILDPRPLSRRDLDSIKVTAKTTLFMDICPDALCTHRLKVFPFDNRLTWQSDPAGDLSTITPKQHTTIINAVTMRLNDSLRHQIDYVYKSLH